MLLPSGVQVAKFHRRVVPMSGVGCQEQRYERVAQTVRILRPQVFSLDHFDVQMNFRRLLLLSDLQQLFVLLVVHFERVLHVREQRGLPDFVAHIAAHVMQNLVEDCGIEIINLQQNSDP